MTVYGSKKHAVEAWLSNWSVQGVNVELLDRVIEHIKQHPEQHNQAEWIEDATLLPASVRTERDWNCGTQACVAGWAALFSGRVEEDFTLDFARGFAGEMPLVSRYAKTVLGLTDCWGEWLFSAARTREEIFEAAEILAGRVTSKPWGEDLHYEFDEYGWSGGWFTDEEVEALLEADLRLPLHEQSIGLLSPLGWTRADVTP